MSDDNGIIERALNAASACLLPTLLEDLDSSSIDKVDYDDFRLMLDDQLHLLLDILYQNSNLLKEQAFDNQLVQLRASLLLVTCEQTEPNPFFQTDQKILISSLNKITEDNLRYFDEAVVQKCFQTYKDGLRKNSWKKQLGMVHGFPKFCEIILNHKPDSVNADLTMFILSVGSNLVAHYDPHYKTIGLKIFRNLLSFSDKNFLKDLNIHQVIYSESVKMTKKSNELSYNDHLFECLFLIVSMENPAKENSRWCSFDDVMSELLEVFGVESGALGILLLNKIVKFCGISYSDIDLAYAENVDELKSHLDQLKTKASKANLLTMRWMKKLMEIMIRESPRMFSNCNESYEILAMYHTIYIISVANIDPTTLGQQLIDSTKKLILVMMQVTKTFESEHKIVQSVILFLKTIEDHHHNNPEFVTCLRKILQHKVFQ